MVLIFVWFYFGLIARAFAQSLMGSPERLTGHCLLPDPPKSGSYFSVFCYGVDELSTECLNVPHTPVRPNWNLTYICDEGYFFPQGQGWIDSQCRDGQWVPKPPPCQDRICAPPRNPPNGWYSPHPIDCWGECAPLGPHLPDNTLLSLRCLSGYLPPVDNNALCVGGYWLEPMGCSRLVAGPSSQIREPTAINPRHSCILPEPPDHGTYFSPTCYSDNLDFPECTGTPGTQVRETWTLTFQCDEGFLPTTNRSVAHSKCIAGRWQPQLPTCHVSTLNSCSLPPKLARGQYEMKCPFSKCGKESVPPGAKLTLSCPESLQPAEGYALSTCVNGSWSPPPPTCSDGSDNFLDHRDISNLQSQFAGCILPEAPLNGRFAVFSETCYGARLKESKCQRSAGQTVPHLQVVSISCDQDYLLDDSGSLGKPTSAYLSCDDGKWSHRFKQCYKPCPSLLSRTVDLECYQGPRLVPCDSPMLPNTTVTSKCKPNHATSDDPRDLVCLPDGRWSGSLPSCKPNCGISKLHNIKIEPTIFGGNASNLGYFPWHAGIFHKNIEQKWENKCGGTLISPHIVLTAAHCVTSNSTKMRAQDVQVALGKYYRDWYVYEAEAVRKKVKDIQIQPNYLGLVSLLDLDIALMALESPVTINSYVMPACVDYRLTHRLQPNMQGYLVGWGKTSECSSCDDGSETLLYANTSYFTFLDCYKEMQKIKALPNTRLTSDKFCAAGDGTRSVAQKGDSGGGVTFVFGGIHYVKGVISAKISYPYSFAAFTNVTHHIRWIQQMASYLDTLVI